jgi:methylenetetrahydrofolate reductase (NADPH)
MSTHDTSNTPSQLQKILKAGHFAVTSKCGPPRSADGQVVEEKARILGPYVDAINVTDNETAVVHLCSLAGCIRIKQMGLEPVLEMATRDRNRIGLQSDILGAASFDIHNILCLPGDLLSLGDHPGAVNVSDLDSMQLIDLVKKMRDEGRLLNGFEMEMRPEIFVGTVEDPFADPSEKTIERLTNKIVAGAQFIQTQCIYNMNRFKEWVQRIVDCGLHDQISILVGLTPLKGVAMARYMKSSMPGMDVPAEIIRRLTGVPKDRQAQEGVNICVEQIKELKEVKGIRGFHIMTIDREETVPEIVERAGLYPRPKVD